MRVFNEASSVSQWRSSTTHIAPEIAPVATLLVPSLPHSMQKYFHNSEAADISLLPRYQRPGDTSPSYTQTVTYPVVNAPTPPAYSYERNSLKVTYGSVPLPTAMNQNFPAHHAPQTFLSPIDSSAQSHRDRTYYMERNNQGDFLSAQIHAHRDGHSGILYR